MYDALEVPDQGKAISVLNVELDPKYKKYERRVYSFLDWLGDVGGLNDAIQSIFVVFTGLIIA